jgi:hypothetical protein
MYSLGHNLRMDNVYEVDHMNEQMLVVARQDRTARQPTNLK